MARIQLKERGGVLLGKNVSCDGFSCEHPVRVQTHIHSDHMSEFDTSKANQTIIMSRETRDLLISIYNADLPYRSNIITLDPGQKYEINGDILELIPSNHMLGSVQVKVECNDGYRLGYSSDFFWPVDEAVQVDELIVDSTYGDPTRVRRYTQNHVSEKLTEVVCSSISSQRGVAIVGHNGRLQNVLYLIAEFVTTPILASPKAYPLFESYRRFGYHMPEVIRSDSADGISLLKERAPIIAMVTLNERRHIPWVDRLKKVTISAHMSRPHDPVTYYDNGDCCVALTDHADFLGTMEYIKATGAKLVWTDPRSGNAEALADAIRKQLGLRSSVMPHIHSLGWG
jgi:putative mRNA 3-end processing factor